MQKRSSWILPSLALALCASAAGEARALDFDDLAHGEIANGSWDGVAIDAENFARSFDYAVGFDTRRTGTQDDDLEAAASAPYWSGGNLANQALNVILVLQENKTGCSDGVCNVPDDEGSRNAGRLIFDFDVALVAFGFDAIDVEDAMAENGRVDFFADGDSVPEATVEFADFVTPGSAFYDPSVVYGNRTANRIDPISAELLGIEAFDRVVIMLGGSGGIDNLCMTPLPEASTGGMIALGLLVAARRRAGGPEGNGPSTPADGPL
jgi:hypothetical protein